MVTEGKIDKTGFASYRTIPSLRENKPPKYSSRGGQQKRLDDYLGVL